MSVFAHGLYNTTNREVIETCVDKPMYEDAFVAFGNTTEFVDADLYKGGLFLGCTFGAAAMYIWAVGILSAGQSSTMTGTYAGQFAMEVRFSFYFFFLNSNHFILMIIFFRVSWIYNGHVGSEFYLHV